MRKILALVTITATTTGPAVLAQSATGDAPSAEVAAAPNAEPSAAAPNAEPSAEGRIGPDPTKLALARALDERMTVWRSPGGRRVYVRSCRRAHLRGGCRARIAALSDIFVRVGRDRGVDPFLLAAMALRESGLNPEALGGAGERGIVQLHPRGVGSHVRFVRSEAYRRRCARRPDSCQGEVVDAGARLLARAIRSCGTVVEALGAYNGGECGATDYGRRVLGERVGLIRLAKGPASPAAHLVD